MCRVGNVCVCGCRSASEGREERNSSSPTLPRDARTNWSCRSQMIGDQLTHLPSLSILPRPGLPAWKWGEGATENESTGNPSPMHPPGPFLMRSKRMWASGIALRSWGLSILLEYEMPLREEYLLHLVVASSYPSGLCL